jgi:hypothetical protein
MIGYIISFVIGVIIGVVGVLILIYLEFENMGFE